MLMNISKVVNEYISDLGPTYNKVPFKIKDGFQDIIQYADREAAQVCAPNQLFEMRYLEVTYTSGETIKHPIGRTSDLLQQVQGLLARTEEPKVACINYIGERWSYVPASIIGLTAGYNTENRYTVTASGVRENGTFTYNSDVLGELKVGYSIELAPDQLLQIAKQCMDGISGSAICASPIPGFKPRRYTLAFINQNDRRISRFARVSTYSNIAACGRTVGAEAICMGYEGEVIPNIHNLVAATP